MPEHINVAVFVSGRGSNLKALLDAKAAGRLARVRFAAVFSDVENPPAFGHARAHGVPVLHISPKIFGKGNKADYERAVLDVLAPMKIDYLVLAGYMRIVGATLLDAFPNRIVNIHPSLLPAFPGLHAQRQAVEHGVKLSGCTVHFVDSGVDSGPIILQRAVPVYANDDEASLSARILEQEHQALPLALEWISEGRILVRNRHVLVEGESRLPRASG